MNIGDRIMHPMHGEGEIISLSTSEAFAVVKYTTSGGKNYYRTHAVITLKIVDGDDKRHPDYAEWNSKPEGMD